MVTNAERGLSVRTNATAGELIEAWFEQAAGDFSPKTVMETDRTFLARLRTGIALFGLAFGVANVALIVPPHATSHGKQGPRQRRRSPHRPEWHRARRRRPAPARTRLTPPGPSQGGTAAEVTAYDRRDGDCGISRALRSDRRLYVDVHNARQPPTTWSLDEPEAIGAARGKCRSPGVRRYKGQTPRAERHHHSHWRHTTRTRAGSPNVARVGTGAARQGEGATATTCVTLAPDVAAAAAAAGCAHRRPARPRR